jgi:hypothetical protein
VCVTSLRPISTECEDEQHSAVHAGTVALNPDGPFVTFHTQGVTHHRSQLPQQY